MVYSSLQLSISAPYGTHICLESSKNSKLVYDHHFALARCRYKQLWARLHECVLCSTRRERIIVFDILLDFSRIICPRVMIYISF